MSNDDVDMEGQPIDRAMELASRVVDECATDQPDFAGLWLDTEAREIHIAFVGRDVSATIANLQADVPSEVRLRGHEFQHSISELEALGSATSDYLGREGYWALYGVGLGIQVKTNRVHLNLKHTTPAEIEKAIRAHFAGAPLEIELTTARWVAQ
jgi:hypothetical protein